MIVEKCPHCQVSHVQTDSKFQDRLKVREPEPVWQVVRCQNGACQGLILVEIVGGKVHVICPDSSFELRPTAELPEEVEEDFREAGKCLGAGCYKASLVMSRRVLQRCLKQQGCTKKKLVGAIDEAVKQGILRKQFHSLATEIREYGNLGAHPDDEQLSSASRESAQQVLDFARLLIHDFYELPAEAATLKKKREDADASA